MGIKTSKLQGVALDWTVAKCEGKIDRQEVLTIGNQLWTWKDGERCQYIPATNWSQGGPIIAREMFAFEIDEDMETIRAYYPFKQGVEDGVGSTHLIAAMRCYVASKLGDEIEVPEELLVKE